MMASSLICGLLKMNRKYDVYLCREKSELQKIIEENQLKQWNAIREDIRDWFIAHPIVWTDKKESLND